MAQNTKTPAMVLQELAVKYKLPPPTYEIVYSITGTHENRFDYQVHVAGIVAQGTGSSKQISKHMAAHNALMKLKEIGVYNPSENPVQEFNVPLQKSTSDSPYQGSLNCIGPLKDLCLEHKIPDPVFTMISGVGPPHSKVFTYECNVASIKTSGTSTTKKIAKQLAAQEMLDRIKDVLPEIAAQYKDKNVHEPIADSTDNEALRVYNEFFGSIVPNKSVKIDDYPLTLKKLMMEKNLTIEDFQMEFSKKDEEALKQALEKLGLSYKFYHMQDNPIMISLSFDTDTPFTTIGMSFDSPEAAKREAIASAFEIMETFMR